MRFTEYVPPSDKNIFKKPQTQTSNIQKHQIQKSSNPKIQTSRMKKSKHQKSPNPKIQEYKNPPPPTKTKHNPNIPNTRNTQIPKSQYPKIQTCFETAYFLIETDVATSLISENGAECTSLCWFWNQSDPCRESGNSWRDWSEVLE